MCVPGPIAATDGFVLINAGPEWPLGIIAVVRDALPCHVGRQYAHLGPIPSTLWRLMVEKECWLLGVALAS